MGDRTPIYMYWNPAPQRIAAYNPAMKWIMLLRNPATRAYSQWNMEIKQGRETLPFEVAVRTEAERCRAVLPVQHRRWSYVDRGRYAAQLRRIAESFPASQSWPEERSAARRSGVRVGPGCRIPRHRTVSAHGAARSVCAALRCADDRIGASLYMRTLAPDIRELERMLGWDCATGCASHTPGWPAFGKNSCCPSIL